MYNVSVSLCGVAITELTIKAEDSLTACNIAERQMESSKNPKINQLVRKYKLVDLFFDYEARREEGG